MKITTRRPTGLPVKTMPAISDGIHPPEVFGAPMRERKIVTTGPGQFGRRQHRGEQAMDTTLERYLKTKMKIQAELELMTMVALRIDQFGVKAPDTIYGMVLAWKRGDDAPELILRVTGETIEVGLADADGTLRDSGAPIVFKAVEMEQAVKEVFQQVGGREEPKPKEK